MESKGAQRKAVYFVEVGSVKSTIFSLIKHF